MKLTSAGEVRRLMEENGLRFNKGYGQNFLVSDSIPGRIAEGCGAEPEDGILEIGPGIGTLTRELCRRYGKVVAVEIDASLIPVLKKTTEEFDNLTVLCQDILKVDLSALLREQFGDRRVTVCANLPYYITTPILMKLLESDCRFENITVMVQKEVAGRLCAKPGEPDYGALTAAVARYGKVTRLLSVSPGCFLPAPKVSSAVVKISLYRERPYKVKDEALMTRCIRGAFSQRRKTLANSLSSEFSECRKEEILKAIAACGFPPDIRGERLGVSEFAALSDAIGRELEGKKPTAEKGKGNHDES